MKHKKEHGGKRIIQAERTAELLLFRACGHFSCRFLLSLSHFHFQIDSGQFTVVWPKQQGNVVTPSSSLDPQLSY